MPLQKKCLRVLQIHWLVLQPETNDISRCCVYFIEEYPIVDMIQNSELRTQKFIQHNTRVKNVQQCYCIKIIKYFNYVIFMYYVMEIEQRLFNR